jgi:hypothetical protein
MTEISSFPLADKPPCHPRPFRRAVSCHRTVSRCFSLWTYAELDERSTGLAGAILNIRAPATEW